MAQQEYLHIVWRSRNVCAHCMAQQKYLCTLHGAADMTGHTGLSGKGNKKAVPDNRDS